MNDQLLNWNRYRYQLPLRFAYAFFTDDSIQLISQGWPDLDSDSRRDRAKQRLDYFLNCLSSETAEHEVSDRERPGEPSLELSHERLVLLLFFPNLKNHRHWEKMISLSYHYQSHLRRRLLFVSNGRLPLARTRMMILVLPKMNLELFLKKEFVLESIFNGTISPSAFGLPIFKFKFIIF